MQTGYPSPALDVEACARLKDAQTLSITVLARWPALRTALKHSLHCLEGGALPLQKAKVGIPFADLRFPGWPIHLRIG
jgi:hypothetical protein